MNTRTPMTSAGYKRLKEELHRLKTVDRIKASQAIGEAREHGDISENAEYEAAKDAQGMLEARIRMLESKLSTAQVIEISSLSGTRVVFGATIQISDVETGDERTITIVGDEEVDVDRGLISLESPLARGLIGKNLDDVVRIKLPAGVKEYEILEVRFEEINLE